MVGGVACLAMSPEAGPLPGSLREPVLSHEGERGGRLQRAGTRWLVFARSLMLSARYALRRARAHVDRAGRVKIGPVEEVVEQDPGVAGDESAAEPGGARG